MILIAVFLAIFVWLIYFFVKYSFNKTIKTTTEISSYYHIPVLGKLPSSSMDKIDKVRAKLNGKYHDIDYIKLSISVMGLDKVILVGNKDDAEINNVFNSLSSFPSNYFCSKDRDALNTVKEIRNEILVLHTRNTSYQDLELEINTCKLQNINIVGVIVID